MDSENESNMARPSVTREGGLYKIWYSYVKSLNLYKIGNGDSDDGKVFTRKDSKAKKRHSHF